MEKAPRKSYLDNLRILLAVLVIIGHAAVAYGPVGFWYYNEVSDSISIYFLAFVVAFLQAFIIGLFFMLSSYFMPSSYERKGSIRFLKDRLKRLGIPLLFYVFLANPVFLFMTSRFYGLTKESFFEFYFNKVLKEVNLDTGPLWFIQLLLIFTFLYIIGLEVLKRSGWSFGKAKKDFPKDPKIWAFIIIFAVSNYFLRYWFPIDRVVGNLQLSYMPQYIFLFLLGIYSYHHGWFEKVQRKEAIRWSLIGLFSILLWPLIIYLSGAFTLDITRLAGSFYWQSFLYSLWESIACVSIIIGSIYLFRCRFDRQSVLLKKISGDVYSVFIVHPIVLIPVSFAFAGLELDPIFKFFIVIMITIPLCFFIGHYLRKIPFLKKII